MQYVHMYVCRFEMFNNHTCTYVHVEKLAYVHTHAYMLPKYIYVCIYLHLYLHRYMCISIFLLYLDIVSF